MGRLSKSLILGSTFLVGLAAAPARAGYIITTSITTNSQSTSSTANSVTIYSNGNNSAGSGASATGSLTLTSPTTQVASGSSMDLVLAGATTAATGSLNPQTNFNANVMITITVTSTTTNMTGTIVLDDMLGGTFNNPGSMVTPYAQTLGTGSFIGPMSVAVDGTTFTVGTLTNSTASKNVSTMGTTNFSLADFGSILEISPAAVPEPSSVVMVLSGLGGLAMAARRRRSRGVGRAA